MNVEWIDPVPLWLPHVERFGWVGKDGTGAIVIEASFDIPAIRHPDVSYETFEEIRPKLENYFMHDTSPDAILGTVFRSTPTVTEDQSPWVRPVQLTCHNCDTHGFKEMVTPSGYLCSACNTYAPCGSAERDSCGHEVPGIWVELGNNCPKCELAESA